MNSSSDTPGRLALLWRAAIMLLALAVVGGRSVHCSSDTLDSLTGDCPVRLSKSLPIYRGHSYTSIHPTNEIAFFEANEISVSRARCARVVDGDTIIVELLQGPEQGKQVRLRYIGIDAPESSAGDRAAQPWSAEATAANRCLVEGDVVYLEQDVSETDRYGRLLRHVWISTSAGPRLVSAALVADGYAFAVSYPPDVKYQDWLNELAGKARTAGHGVWSGE